jgi:GLPGLI family protein
MLKFTKHILFVSIIIASFTGCQNLFNKGQSEGAIEYKLTMQDSSSNAMMASMMPKTMLLKFKNNKTVMEFKIGMGMMTTSFISNPETKTLTTLVQVMIKKNAFVLDQKAIDKKNRKLSKFSITYSNDTKIIAGFKCKRAIIKDSTSTYDIYYTKEINIKDANWSNPYKDIDGVLMEYRIKIKNIELNLTAINVSGDKIDDSVFTIPSGYNIIKPEDLKKEVN